MVPRHAIDPSRDGVCLVPAEHHAAGLGLAVDQVVRIAEAGHIVRQLVPGHGQQRGVLVVDRGRDDEGAGHRGDLWGPDAARDHDHLSLDTPGVSLDRFDRACSAELDSRDAALGEHVCSQLASRGGEGIGRGVWIEVPIARDPDRSVERTLGDRRYQLDVEPDASGAADAPLQLLQLFVAGGKAQAPDLLEDTELLIQLDAVTAESHHRRRWIELSHKARGVARRAAGQLVLFEEDGVAPASLRQVVGDARPRDAATNDDCSRAVHFRVTLVRKRGLLRLGKQEEQHGACKCGQADRFDRPPEPD